MPRQRRVVYSVVLGEEQEPNHAQRSKREGRIISLGRHRVGFTILVLCVIAIEVLLSSQFKSSLRSLEYALSNNYNIIVKSVLADDDNEDSNTTIRFCPSVWNFFNATTDREYLIEKWKEAHAYHNLGGNLKALAQFLDAAIDGTYGKLGLAPFDVGGGGGGVVNNVEGSSISQQILSQLQKQDNDGRGGYYQRKLPGAFRGPGAQRLTVGEQRMLPSVVQPLSSSRWDVAMGPRLDDQNRTCRGFYTLEGPPRRRYEDKYICAWDQFTNSGKENDENSGSTTPSCHMVSIGSNDQWGFETQIVRSTNCQVATFDCTLLHPPQHKPPTDQVKFYDQCISDKTMESVSENGQKRSFATYFDMLARANLTHVPRIDYLKMDVEGYEYNVLTEMIASAAANPPKLRHLLPEQLQLEFHYATWMYDLSPGSTLRTRETGELMAFFSMLFREAGYIAVYVDINPGTPGLREALLLRVFC